MILTLLKKILYISCEECLDLLHIRRLPRVIQLPITGKCNSRCVTCNVWKHKAGIDMSAEKLRKVLQDPFFSKVHGVGINGGELTLHNDVEGIFRAVLTLPHITDISVISNGLITLPAVPPATVPSATSSPVCSVNLRRGRKRAIRNIADEILMQ